MNKFETFKSIVLEHLSNGELFIIYNEMAKESGCEMIRTMDEFNDITFDTNLTLISSISEDFSALDDYFYYDNAYDQYFSCNNVLDAIEDLSSINDLTDYFISNYYNCITRIDNDLSNTIKNEFIKFKIDNYNDIPIEWFVQNIDFDSILVEDWSDYLDNLEKEYNN